MSNADGRILVTFEKIGQASADCQTINGQLQQELGDLRSYLAPMVVVWTGQAAEEYQGLQRDWDRCAEDLSDLLMEISRALSQAQQNYVDTERANSSIWAG